MAFAPPRICEAAAIRTRLASTFRWRYINSPSLPPPAPRQPPGHPHQPNRRRAQRRKKRAATGSVEVAFEQHYRVSPVDSLLIDSSRSR